MPAAILAVLARLGQDLAACLAPEAIRDACREEEYRWRDRVLDPVATVGYGLVRVLQRNAACRHLVHFGGSTFSASAYCQARKRLPLAVLQRLLAAVTAKARGAAADVGRWRGHRVWAEDGSSFSMPDVPELAEAFGRPSGQAEGCGFPTARWLVLFDVATGLLVKSLAIPLREQDVTRCRELAGAVEAGDVVLGDRGFCSYAHLAILKARGVFAVFRTQGSQIVDFTPGREGASEAARAGRATRGLPRSRWVRAMGRRDQVVLMDRPDERPPWMTAEEFAALPAEVEARELEYDVEAKGFRVRRVRLTTTLTDDAAYPASALAELYLSRWRAEDSHAGCPSRGWLSRAA